MRMNEDAKTLAEANQRISYLENEVDFWNRRYQEQFSAREKVTERVTFLEAQLKNIAFANQHSMSCLNDVTLPIVQAWAADALVPRQAPYNTHQKRKLDSPANPEASYSTSTTQSAQVCKPCSRGYCTKHLFGANAGGVLTEESTQVWKPNTCPKCAGEIWYDGDGVLRCRKSRGCDWVYSEESSNASKEPK